MSNASISTPAADVWAEVRANDQVIRYRRWGSGRPVLVLRPEGPEHASRRGLLEALGARFRLLVPELPPRGGDVAARLALFLDGLGVGNVAVLAMGELCLPALELALLGGDQVARLALVTDGPSELPELGGALVTTPGQPALPLVLIRDLGQGLEDVPLLLRFLGNAA